MKIVIIFIFIFVFHGNVLLAEDVMNSIIKKWEASRSDIKYRTPGAINHIKEFFKSNLSEIPRDQLLKSIKEENAELAGIQFYVKSYLIEEMLADANDENLISFLSDQKIDYVWDQRLDYFLACRNQGAKYDALFQALKNVITASEKDDIKKSLWGVINKSFPNENFTMPTTSAEVEVIRNRCLPILKSLSLDPLANQTNISYEMMNFGLSDYSEYQEKMRVIAEKKMLERATELKRATEDSK